MVALKLNVNGRERELIEDPSRSLLSVLRDYMHLTGAKPGCGEGQCGACTVLIDGQAVRSCITPVRAADRKAVLTIEGLTVDSKLHGVQESFLAHSAFQCGYCTTGMIMASVALLNKIPNPTIDDIRRELDGNVCRCGTYPRIIKAIQHIAQGPIRA